MMGGVLPSAEAAGLIVLTVGFVMFVTEVLIGWRVEQDTRPSPAEVAELLIKELEDEAAKEVRS
jgi:hypothetical protein